MDDINDYDLGKCNLELLDNINTKKHHKIIVAGSRNYTDTKAFTEVMYTVLNRLSKATLISGVAKGPDSMAIDFYKQHKDTVECDLELKKFPAKWDDISGLSERRIKVNKQGKPYNPAAGIIRNNQMLEEATMLVAFWDYKSKGTRNMITISLGKGIPVIIIKVKS